MIPLFKVYMSSHVDKPLLEILHSGYIGQGKEVEKFEDALKIYLDNDFVITLNNGTAGLHLALHMIKNQLKLSNDSEVLTTPLTCTATNWPILANNLRIKWVDVDPNNLNIDMIDLERKITTNTKVIMVVHWGGYPVDLNRLKYIQEKTFNQFGFKPFIIEDCAHALGARYAGKMIGSFGNFCSFSLQAIKHVTAVDGGILTLPNENLYRKAKLLRWYGIDRESNRKDFRCETNISEYGFKFHMNDVNAIIGMYNFNHIDEILKIHKSNAEYYNNQLNKISGIRLLENYPGAESSYWLYTMMIERRDDFMKWMKECKIMVSRVHERNDIHSCVKEFRAHLPALDEIVKNMICIPVGWWVTEENREYIVDCIKRGW